MQAISCPIIITSIRSRKDGSLGFSAETPELSAKEKVAWMELQGINTKAVFNPLDTVADDVVEIEKDIEQKTQAQRIRAVLFLIWRQNGEQGEFTDFYKEKTEKYINYLKEMLD